MLSWSRHVTTNPRTDTAQVAGFSFRLWTLKLTLYFLLIINMLINNGDVFGFIHLWFSATALQVIFYFNSVFFFYLRLDLCVVLPSYFKSLVTDNFIEIF